MIKISGIPTFKRSLVAFGMVLICVMTRPADAQLRLPEIYQDHMVIQRDQPIRIWGWASPSEEIVVRLHGESVSGMADRQGRWALTLSALPAGGPYELTVEGSTRIVLSDILVGDVWICGGQSNMAWKVRETDFVEQDQRFLSKNQVRLFTADMAMDYKPKDDLSSGGWMTLARDNVLDFSAVGYHFGKYLQQELNVPIGLISANLGATAVETWMSNEALMDFPQFQEEVGPIVKANKNFDELVSEFEKRKGSWYHKTYLKGRGIEEAWYKPETNPQEWRAIAAAGNTWEEEPELKDFDGAVWFRTTFDLPENYLHENFLISLGQIDNYDIAWVNGKQIGETFGRHNHRNYSVPVTALKRKGNVLVVRVFDTGGIGGFTTSPFWASPTLAGEWVYRKGDAFVSKGFRRPNLPNATPFSSPGVLFNGMIAPLTAFPIKGVIWYQGESNASRAYEYRELFPAMIRDWRSHWGQGNFPFLYVQLANYMREPELPAESSWAELREAQAMALRLDNTGMATAIDIGDANDIHPRNKADVGKRLGQSAMKVAYKKENTSWSGPIFTTMEKDGEWVTLSFDHVGGGLVTKDRYGYIRGFQVAGADKKFYWAQAFIDGDRVRVRSKDVNDPVAVRYAWADNPGRLDLYNAEGLPALPFRTDDWQGVTHGKVFSDGPRF